MLVEVARREVVVRPAPPCAKHPLLTFFARTGQELPGETSVVFEGFRVLPYLAERLLAKVPFVKAFVVH